MKKEKREIPVTSLVTPSLNRRIESLRETTGITVSTLTFKAIERYVAELERRDKAAA